jgi:hypothetical protein
MGAFPARLRSPAPRDTRGVDLISDALSFGRLWYGEPNAIATRLTTQSIGVGHIAL